MLVIKLRNSYYVISTQLCGLILGIIMFHSVKYLLEKNNRPKNNTKDEDKKIRRVTNFALFNTRGGDLPLDKALDLIDGPGYYELVDFQFTKELKKILKCRSQKPILIVTAGVLRAVEKHMFANKSSLLKWIPSCLTVLQFYRSEKIFMQGVVWALTFGIAHLFAPVFAVGFEAFLFGFLVTMNTGYTVKDVVKLPTILPTVQYIHQYTPKKLFAMRSQSQPQRVIMQVGDTGKLFQKIVDKILKTQVAEVRAQGEIFKFDGDPSQIVPVSNTVAKKILSENKQIGESTTIIDVKTEVNSLVTVGRTEKKYVPLSHRTKTLKDIEENVSISNFKDAKEFEHTLDEKCKSKPARFLQIDNK